MESGGFEIIEHTADVALRIRGETIEGVFEQAARGLYQIIGELAGKGDRREYVIALTADSVENLFHDWLAEVLYWFDVREIIFDTFEIHVSDERSLKASVVGRQLDVDHSRIFTEVKAVTYHHLKIGHCGRELVATVVLDV